MGVLISVSPFFSPIDLNAQFLIGFALLLTYVSIGLLVALLPARRPYWLFGMVVGLLYSLPGAVFTAVPYPLDPAADVYWREFAAGGLRAFLLTLLAGAVVGLLCGALRRDLGFEFK
jgi:hypothetical protein